MDNLRRFILVFTAVIFITLCVCGLVLADSYQKTAKTEERELSVSAPTYDPNGTGEDASQALKENILFIVGDQDGTETELMVLAHVDSENSSLHFLYIPKDLKYALNSDRSVGNMGNLLAKTGSAASAADTVASFFEISVDYYVQMPCNTFAEFINAFDRDSTGIDYTIPVDLKYVSGKYHIDLKKDTKKLTGTEALQLIQFYRTENNEYSAALLAYYDGSDVKRIQAAQSFLSAFLSQKVIKTGDQAYAQTFTDIVLPFLEECETNLTETQIRKIGGIFSAINANAVKYYRFNGTEEYLGKYYLVYDETCTDLTSNAILDGATILRDSFSAN